jgi:hypothetical protein
MCFLFVCVSEVLKCSCRAGVDWTAGGGDDDTLSESASQRSPLRSPSAMSMAPMSDDASVIVAALSQRLRQEQSRSQTLQRELQVLRSSEALTFDIQVGPDATCSCACDCVTRFARLLQRLKSL